MKFVILSLLMITFGCSTRKGMQTLDSCHGPLEVQFERVSTNDSSGRPIADLKLKSFVVHFLNDFEDSVYAFVNEKLIFKDYVQTNQASGSAEKYFGYDYSNDKSNSLVLKVVGSKSCFKVNVNKKFKVIYLFKSPENQWTVRFSNFHYLNE